MNNNLGTLFTGLLLTSIFEFGRVCKTFVTYQIPQKDKDDLLHVFECVNKHLPKDLTQYVMNIFTKCYNHDIYDECLSRSCINESCHIHCDPPIPMHNMLKLAECVVQIKLKQL